MLTGLCRSLRTSLTIRPLTTTPSVAMSAMTKKKRRVDPANIRQKEERKRKKLQKAVKKLSRKKRIVKPLLELQVSQEVFQQSESGVR